MPGGQLAKPLKPLPLAVANLKIEVVAKVRQALVLGDPQCGGLESGDLFQPGHPLIACGRQQFGHTLQIAALQAVSVPGDPHRKNER